MACADTLNKPLGGVPMESVAMTRQTVQSLRRVVAQFLPEEQRHWEESGEPFDHVYHDLVAVRWALREYDNDKEQERKDLSAMNELAVRLSQG